MRVVSLPSWISIRHLLALSCIDRAAAIRVVEIPSENAIAAAARAFEESLAFAKEYTNAAYSPGLTMNDDIHAKYDGDRN